MDISQLLVVNFVVFGREVELQSFYSAVLILAPVCLFGFGATSRHMEVLRLGVKLEL